MAQILSTNKVQRICCWQHHPHNYLKLNMDGAIFFDYQKVGISFILRDEQGETLKVASKVETQVNKPEDIELLDIFRVMQTSAGMSIQHLVVESDNLPMIKELQAEGASTLVLGNLLVETKKLQLMFTQYSFNTFIRRLMKQPISQLDMRGLLIIL